MTTGWYTEKGTIWTKEESEEIQEEQKIVAAVSDLMEGAFGNLEDYDSRGHSVGIYDGRNGEHTGITFVHAIVCEDDMGGDPDFTTYNRIQKDDTYVDFYITSEGTIEEIQTNLKKDNTDILEDDINKVSQWLHLVFQEIEIYYNQIPPIYYFDNLKPYTHYGKQKTAEVKETKHSIRQH